MAHFVKVKENHAFNLDLMREIQCKKKEILMKDSAGQIYTYEFDSEEECQQVFDTWVSPQGVQSIEEPNMWQYVDKDPSWYNNSVSEFSSQIESSYGARAYHACWRKGIKNLGDVVRLGFDGFRKLHGVGIRTANEVRLYLYEKYNYDLWK